MVREGSRKTAHGSSLKAEGSKFITLPGQSLGKLRSEGGMAFLASLRSAGAELEERKGGGGELGMVFWLQDVRSAPRPSSQTLSIAGSLARLINELFRLTLDLWSKSRALCGSY